MHGTPRSRPLGRSMALIGGMLALALVALWPGQPAVAQRTAVDLPARVGASDATFEMADVFTVDYDGNWFCPADPDRLSVQLCPEEQGEGRSSREFVEYLVQDVVAHPDVEPPAYVRAGKARRFCSLDDWPDGLCATGVPPAPTQPCQDPWSDGYTVTSPFCALQGMKDVGMRLGVVLGAAAKTPDGHNVARSVPELTYHACQISEANSAAGRLYDFMFLDLSFKLKNAALREAVDKIEHGIAWNPSSQQYETCRYGGWPRLVTNDTTYPNRTLATGAWGHAKKFDVLGHTGDSLQPAIDAATGRGPALDDKDLAFVSDVHEQDPGSHAILRFEVPSQTDRFAQLGKGLQCQLLRRWASSQTEAGRATYSMLYPLYVHAVPNKPRTYDSLYRGTFRAQRELIDAFNPDLPDATFSPCPQPPS